MVDVKIFSRKGVEKDERAKEIEAGEVAPPGEEHQGRGPDSHEERNKKIATC